MYKEMDSRVPRIRFKGFVGEWRKKRLGEVYTERNERGNDALQILSVSIHSGVSKGELDEETLGKKVRRSEDKSLYKHVYAGDLVLNMMRAWQGAIGVATIEGMVSPAYITAIPDDAIYPTFMDCGLRRSQIIARMKNLSYGVTDFRKRLYWDSFIRVELYLSSVSEQNKITTYFSRLDDLITLHQRKHEKLVTLKQAMLQRMFPQPDATTPEIRFKGFGGKWTKAELGNVASLLTGHPFEGKMFVSEGVLLVRGMNVKRGYLDASRGISEYWPSVDGFEPFLLEEDDIVIQMDGALIGKSYAKIKKANLPALLVQRVTRVRCKAISCDFIYQYIQRNFLSYIRSAKTETAVPHLSLDDIRKFSVSLPDESEQHKIGAYFRQLDALIDQHATQLAKLKNLKAACLERMFV